MMFIKVHDLTHDECIINASHIICLAYEGSGTTICLENKLSLSVSESMDEILELLKESDPLRSKILEQSAKIDNMLDNMEKRDPWTELLDQYFPDCGPVDNDNPEGGQK